MDVQQISETLSKMEQNLQGVESARQQVQQVATAYTTTRVQIEQLVNHVSQLSENLKVVIETIRQSHQEITGEYSTDIQNALSNISERTLSLKSQANQLNDQFKNKCNETLSEFSSSTNESLLNLQQRIDVIVDNFNEKIAEQISKITQISDKFKQETKRVRTNFAEQADLANTAFKQSLSETNSQHEVAEQSILNDFNTAINNNKVSLNQNLEELQQVLEQYKLQVNAFWKKMDSMLNPITLMLQNICNGEEVIQGQINKNNAQCLESLNRATTMILQDARKKNEMLLEQIKTNKVLLIIIIVLALIIIALKFI